MNIRRVLLIVLLMVLALPAQAHNREECDELKEQIQEVVLESIEMFTPSVLQEVHTHVSEWREACRPNQKRSVNRPIRRPTLGTTEAASRVEQWRGLVSTYFRAEDVDRALCLVWFESRGDPTAQHPVSKASGLFQHLPKYWTDRSALAGVGGTSIFDPTANVIVAAWLRDAGGWDDWSPYNRGECR